MFVDREEDFCGEVFVDGDPVLVVDAVLSHFIDEKD